MLRAEEVGNVIIEDTAERELSRRGDLVVSPQESNDILRKTLPASFVKLRTALKPLVGGNLRRVVYVSYGHPALQGPDNVCTSGRDGFDVHPALDAKPERLQPVAAFVSERFLPAVKALATCGEGILCNDKASESMSFVDAHQQAFAEHGFCVRADTDPAFDRKCFSQTGDSFEQDQTVAPDGPLACDMRASDYRPYASRARWVRTANDSYFTAMTYPQGLPALLKPRDIHDAMWGIVSALYGGAIAGEGVMFALGATDPARYRVFFEYMLVYKTLAVVAGARVWFASGAQGEGALAVLFGWAVAGLVSALVVVRARGLRAG